MRKLLLLGSLIGTVFGTGLARADDLAGITDREIKIANIGPYSGPVANYAALNYGAEAYFRHLNRGGGIHGRTFKIIASDDQCNEAKANAAVKKAVYDDQVFALIGVVCSGPAMAVKPIIVAESVPWMTVAGNPRVSVPVEKTIFQPTYPADRYAAAMVDFILGNPKLQRVGIVQHSTEWAHSSCNPAKEALVKAGREIVAEAALETGSTDATAQVLTIRQARADVVLGCLYQQEVVVLLRDMFKYRAKIPTVINYGSDFDAIVQQVGNREAVANIFYQPFPFEGIPGVGALRVFRDILVTELSKTELPPDGEPTSYYYYGMQTALTFAEGIRRAGPKLSRTAFVNALDGLKQFDTGLLSDPVTFSPEDHVGVKQLNSAGINAEGKVVLYKQWGVELPARN